MYEREILAAAARCKVVHNINESFPTYVYVSKEVYSSIDVNEIRPHLFTGGIISSTNLTGTYFIVTCANTGYNGDLTFFTDKRGYRDTPCNTTFIPKYKF